MFVQQTLAVSTHKKFDAMEFHRRWRLARIAALRGIEGDEEVNLLARVKTDRDSILRTVFDNSRKLGMSLVRYLGLSWELSDIQEVLSFSDAPCLHGTWSEKPFAKVLHRPGCHVAKQVGSFYCDFWREAIDGLIMGVTEVERYARHESRGHGDPGCVDVFFEDRGLRWGAVPKKISDGLGALQEKFRLRKILLTLEGFSEGILYYRLESLSESPNSQAPLCGTGGRMLHEALAREVRGCFPGLMIQDASPLAVYGEGTK